MIPHQDRVPYPGKAGWRSMDVVSSTAAGVPVGARIVAKVDFADDATTIGTDMNAAKANEFLSASGTTTGTSSTLALAQTGFALADGAIIRVKFHTTTVAPFTVNVNGTGAIQVIDAQGNNVANYNINTWATLVYSSSLNRWISQGAGVNPAQFAPANHQSSGTTYGVATAAYYGHPKAGSSTPRPVQGSGSVGTDNGLYARADHEHPAIYGTLGGSLYTHTTYTAQLPVMQVRQAVINSNSPSGYSSGDLWFQFT